MSNADVVRAEKPPLIILNVTIFTLTALVALVAVPWYGLRHGYSAGIWAFFAFFLIANEMSITGGYHRLWAHKAYEAHFILRAFYLLFGTMALQNSAWVWCSGHRRHHLNVDDNEKDPYSSGRGFWFSHIGWMLRDYKSGEVDFSNIPDLRRDKLLAFQHKYYAPLALLTNFGLPTLVGWALGDIWGGLLLAGVLRLVLSHHFTFFINSLAHMWGSRPYTEDNTARDNAVLALVTFGEGYHNFHHIFAHDYRNGVRWWQWDPTKWLISSCSYVGLARRLKRTPAFQIQRAVLAMQLNRAQQKLAQLPQAHRGPTHIEQLRSKIAQEYDALATAVADWTRVKEQWLEEKKRAVIEHWEQASFQTRLHEIEQRLKMQRRRLRVLHAELA
ncbi:MAG TPA: fatty acid desaturase [Steroidobacteraceae bacterium]|nr:fatty acid desaturase [Steroidobacteraceae bacterium]